MKALYADGVSRMSGLASVVLTIAGALTRNPIPQWTLWIAALICFFLAAVKAWTVEHTKLLEELKKNKPLFVVQFGQAISIYLPDQDVTLLLPVVSIVNRGADSSTTDWRVHYKSSSLDQPVEIVRILEPIVKLKIPGQPDFEMNSSDAINGNLTPIPRGGFRNGRLPIFIPGERREEINQDAVITVSVYDYLGDAYHAQFVAQKADRLMFLPTETGKVTKKR